MGLINFKKDKFIDLEKASDEEISRHVRAFTFPPYQLPIGLYKGKEVLLKLVEKKND